MVQAVLGMALVSYRMKGCEVLRSRLVSRSRGDDVQSQAIFEVGDLGLRDSARPVPRLSSDRALLAAQQGKVLAARVRRTEPVPSGLRRSARMASRRSAMGAMSPGRLRWRSRTRGRGLKRII